MCECAFFVSNACALCVKFFEHSYKSISVLLIISCILQQGFPLPVRLKRELIDDSVQHYLTSFGYLSPSSHEAGALRTEESLRNSIRELQEFSGLPITGQIDERTKKLMQTPRCGLPDIEPHRNRRKRFMLHGQKWGYTNLTWSLRSTSLKELKVYEVRYVFAKALDVWAKHSKLTFTEIDSDRADILIYFHRGEHGDNFAFDGQGQILAHAFFPGSGRGGDAHFDLDENWLTREDDEADGTSLFHVAAHEFGHSLGLSHSSVEGALMYPWYQGMQNGFNYELPEDDRLGIQALYGTYQKGWGNIPQYYPPATPRRTPPPPRPTHPPRPTQRTPGYDPRYPYYPNYPQNPRPPKKYPETNPDKPNRKPMHPDRKNPKHNPYYPEKTHTPKYPDRRYPNNHPQYPETTTYLYPSGKRPNNNPDKRPSGNNPPYSSPKENAPPDTCDTSYDAISIMRQEVFIFKDRYFWRIGDNGLIAGYPAELTRMFSNLPSNFTHIDAAYERPNNKLVFFIGKEYFVYTGNTLDRGYPRPLEDLGLPPSLEKLDAAMVWGHNGKTYFFSNNMYWKFDEDLMKVEYDYPRDMSMWKGIGTNIDAAFQWKDGKTYFFKGKGFWKFNDLRMRVENQGKILSAPFWMGCSRNLEGSLPGRKEPYTVALPVESSGAGLSYTVFIVLFSTILQFYNLNT